MPHAELHYGDFIYLNRKQQRPQLRFRRGAGMSAASDINNETTDEEELP
jgi:hypothetical protein